MIDSLRFLPEPERGKGDLSTFEDKPGRQGSAWRWPLQTARSSCAVVAFITLQLLLTPTAWAAPPAVGTITPSSGASAPDQVVTFTTTYTDPNGWQNLREVRLLINTGVSGATAVYVRYLRSTNKLYLRNDADSAWLGGVAPGTAVVLENSQGHLDVAGTTVSGSGTTLTVTWRVSFKPVFAGRTYNNYLWAKDNNSNTGFIQRGTWTVDSTAPTTPAVTDDGAFTASATQLHAAWSSSDAESGIAEYQYAIGTTSGGTEVVTWTSTGTTASVTRTGLTLTNGTTYYSSAKARNGAGSWSTPAPERGRFLRGHFTDNP